MLFLVFLRQVRLVHFISWMRSVPLARAFQEPLRFGCVASLPALTKIILSAQGRQFLGHSPHNELVEGHAFRFRDAARFFQY